MLRGDKSQEQRSFSKAFGSPTPALFAQRISFCTHGCVCVCACVCVHTHTHRQEKQPRLLIVPRATSHLHLGRGEEITPPQSGTCEHGNHERKGLQTHSLRSQLLRFPRTSRPREGLSVREPHFAQLLWGKRSSSRERAPARESPALAPPRFLWEVSSRSCHPGAGGELFMKPSHS